MKAKPEVFVSVDIEADGRIPAINSMLSLGSAAFVVRDVGYQCIDTFEANLEEYPGAIQSDHVMRWWKGHPEAWEYIRTNPESPEIAMKRYLSWLKALPGPPVLAGWPGSYDFMFVFWYLV